MVVAPTNWRERVDPLTILIDDQPWPWQPGSDDQVAIDLGAQLDSGETLTNPVCTLWRLRSFGETEDLSADSKISGAPVVNGTIVLQRLFNLDRGRYYRLEVLHGAAGNRRGANMLIRVPE